MTRLSMWTLNRPKITFSPGFLLLLGIMFYLDDGVGVMIWALLWACAHELGHIAAAALFGGRVEALSLSAAGAELKFCYRAALSYGQESLITLAGPAVNLLTALLLLWLRAYLPAVISLGLGIFNLLPVLPLDGGRVLHNLISQHFGPQAADCVLTVSAGVLVGLMAGFGAVAAIKYANGVLLFLAVWLLAGVVRKKYKK